jgi:hypothetical protein
MSLEEPSQDFPGQPSPANSSRKRPVSESRIQANRRNALRSTGPKTARGKRTVARNAIKHGFLAREVVIAAGDGEESLKEFHAMVEQLCEYYEPVGVIEESLVQTIATCWWRKARVIRAENGEIRKRLDTLAVDRATRNSDKINLDLALLIMNVRGSAVNGWDPDQKLSTMYRWPDIEVAQRNLRGHYSGLAYLGALLSEAKSEIANDGYISEKTRNMILHAFYFWDCEFAVRCFHAGPPEAKAEDRPSEEVVDRETAKERAMVVAFIDSRLGMLSRFEGEAREREELALDADARSFSLPPVDATDKLLRYEAHLDRQLYRAMDQLERLQRQRRGEHVPPPLNINVGRRR